MLFEKNKIKAVLFDLDDTILNTKDAQTNAIREFKKFYSDFKDVDDESFRKYWDKITEECYDKYLAREYSFEQMRAERMKRLFENYGTSISYEEGTERFKTYLKIYENNWMLFNDSEEMIKQLKDKYKIAIVSNGDSRQQRQKIEKVGLNKWFLNIIISEEVGYEKPKKEIFEIACKVVNELPQNCVMIGDKFKVDVEGSINAGLNAIWVNRKNQNFDYKYQIKEIKELENYL